MSWRGRGIGLSNDYSSTSESISLVAAIRGSMVEVLCLFFALVHKVGESMRFAFE